MSARCLPPTPVEPGLYIHSSVRKRCEPSPCTNYCKTPHSKHRRRLRSRAIVLGCWLQSRRLSRVQLLRLRPQNPRCGVLVAPLCQWRLNECSNKLPWLVLQSTSEMTRRKGRICTLKCCTLKPGINTKAKKPSAMLAGMPGACATWGIGISSEELGM